MKKTLLISLIFTLICVLNLNAVVKVAYVTKAKSMDAAATTPENDPIIQVLKADANLAVTVYASDGSTAITDLATYDVIVVQESFGSGDAILKPGASLGIATMPKPFIYNKSYGLRNGKALTSGSAAAAESASLSFTVEQSALTNDIFKACTIGSANEIAIFVANTDDTGAAGTKSLNYTTGNVVSNSNTLLAQPTGTSTAVFSVNDCPAGTTIDSETLTQRMISICMNFGSICANGGNNITTDGLTIWRNAVYMLGGLTVPSTKAVLPSAVNPLNDFSALSFDGKYVRNNDNTVVNIFNVAGKLISTSSEKEIDLSNFTKGIYIVKSTTNTLKVSILR